MVLQKLLNFGDILAAQKKEMFDFLKKNWCPLEQEYFEPNQ